ncbi:hypothetical protein EC844_11122 [Acinetobacter calcoaceticus]|uniref:Uncharacterized protein n=1 Tax=Acinetobacter calcoaceticus TaxID=471 RepID=A0A4R1Y3U5_ACICA|nr:hypothetical protein EC844_11122 [Acinetobacter calcoaceticus]
MALDQIWKRQLTLVSYGNDYLAQGLSVNQWRDHQIFDQHLFEYRDLLSQYLLAQHFQIWLDGLRQQGVKRISLHHASMLKQEQNPNPNIELLARAHFIVSHHATQKIAWIFGKELAEWYSAEENYHFPNTQRSNLRHEVYWRFELNAKLAKQIEQDLVSPNWDDIQSYTDFELFDSRNAKGFIDTTPADLYYYGDDVETTHQRLSQVSASNSTYLALLPERVQAPYAHLTLHRLHALSQFINSELNPTDPNQQQMLNQEELLNLKHFSQKIDEITAKFVVKVANHYPSAQLTAKVSPSPFETSEIDPSISSSDKATQARKAPTKVGKSSVFTLIIVTVLLCFAAYYFGL